MSVALIAGLKVGSTFCQKWSRLQLMHKSFACTGHRQHRISFLARSRTGSLALPRPAAPLTRAEPFHSSSLRPKRRTEEPPPPRELDLLRYDLKALKRAPRPALCLGLCGLVPFVTAPLLMAVTETYLPEAAFAQVMYGASVVSFLGGARWGFALPEGSPAQPDWLNLANGVVPALIAWLAMLFSHNITQASMLVIMGLGISLHYDLSLLPTYPSWFKALRTILTTVAFLSLVATLVIKGFYPEKRYLLNS